MSDGVLVVDKPIGPTSHDIVAQARRLYGTRAVGHAGTLDPMASGVLLLLFGQATKLSAYLTREHKRYLATVAFGRSTNTLDRAGETVQDQCLPAGWLAAGELERALTVERARVNQVPPSFSAIKVDGRRAYRASRRGEQVELETRAVNVQSIELVESGDERAVLDVWVSKGYYVRALARDLGNELGVPAHLSELRRLASGQFVIDEAVVWPPSEPPELLQLSHAAARCLPILVLTDAGEQRARLGQRLSGSHFVGQASAPATSPAAWLSGDGRLVAIGQMAEEDSFKVIRGFR